VPFLRGAEGMLPVAVLGTGRRSLVAFLFTSSPDHSNNNLFIDRSFSFWGSGKHLSWINTGSPLKHKSPIFLWHSSSTTHVGSMCLKSSLISEGGAVGAGDATVGTNALKKAADSSLTIIRGLSPASYSKRKLFLLICLFCILAGSLVFALLYSYHQGFRRTVQFWKGMGPIVAEHRFLKYKAKYYDRCEEDGDEYKSRMKSFNQRAAPKIVDLIQSLGGIYIKIGQVMSTLGQGLLPEEYVKALRPLQDGVPPRNIAQISQIIEKSTGKKMEEIFSSFDEEPVGSASIAQAHRATLRALDGSASGEEVIVKVRMAELV